MDTWKIILDWIMANGYFGLFLFGILNFAIPSEIVIPFAGYLVFQNKLDFALVIISALAGNIIKSSAFFWFGKKFGKGFLIKYSRWTHVSESSIIFVKTRIEQYGYWIIIPGQFIPYFRRFISGPAGIIRLNFKTFLIYNSIGVTLWFGFLETLGYLAGKNWGFVSKKIAPIMGEVGYIISVLAFIVFLYEVVRWWNKRTNQN